MRSFRKNQRAASTGVLYVLITMMVMILVSIIVVNAIIGSVEPDDTWSAEANDTWDDTQTYIWLGFSLVVIGLVIVAAVSIMSMLKG